MFILRPLGAHPNCAGFVRVEGHVPFAGNVFDFVTFSYLFTQNINCVFFWDLNYRICRILSCAEFVTKSNLKRASVFGIWLVCRVGHYKGSAVSLKLDKTKVFAKQS